MLFSRNMVNHTTLTSKITIKVTCDKNVDLHNCATLNE